MGILNTFFVRFLPVLIATLIGVITAFELERWRDDRKSKARVLEQLRSLKKELDENLGVQSGHNRVIQRQQSSSRTEGDHYTLDLYSTDVWDAVLEDNLLDVIPADLFYDLQDLYSEIKSINELVRRLRTEALHPDLGEIQDSSFGEHRIWTQTVDYFDKNRGEIRSIGLGAQIRNRGDNIGSDMENVQQEIDTQIERLEKELSDP